MTIATKNNSTTKNKEDLKNDKPKKYKVLVHNDDFTPFPFVLDIFQRYFRKNEQEAFLLTQEVHKAGCAIAGIYTHDIAQTKISQVDSESYKEGHPLLLTCELE